jgi:hypothetical protein
MNGVPAMISAKPLLRNLLFLLSCSSTLAGWTREEALECHQRICVTFDIGGATESHDQGVRLIGGDPIECLLTSAEGAVSLRVFMPHVMSPL